MGREAGKHLVGCLTELAANGLGNALLRRPGPGIDLGGQRGSGGITVWFD
tara:strand:+ start:549 stop:698 length:150 start_codon:yes stop_codon:yes gene_type:complete